MQATEGVLLLSKIKENPANPRIIKDDKFKSLVKSIADFPEMLDKRPMVCVTEEDGTIIPIGGNMRLKAIKELGYKEIPESWVVMADDWSEEKRREFIIKDNISGGEWDWEELGNHWEAEQLIEWGLDIPDFGVKAEAEEDDFDTTPPEIPKTVLGDLYEIGEHRLLCGDSTDSDAVTRLMDGQMIGMVFTSPPYNSGGNSGTGGYRGNSKRETKDFYHEQEKSDNWTKEEYFDFCISILNNISINCDDDTAILWNVMYNANSRDDYGKIIFSDINPFSVKETIIWDKGVGMNICSTGILSRTCELIFLLSRGDKYYTNQKQDTYWNTWRISNKQGENMKWGHGASFPIGLPFEGIEKFSNKDHIIYEPFTGSGTTMAAAHQLNRKCYGMELDCGYADVIVKRMLALDNTLTIKRNGIDVTEEWIK